MGAGYDAVFGGEDERRDPKWHASETLGNLVERLALAPRKGFEGIAVTRDVSRQSHGFKRLETRFYRADERDFRKGVGVSFDLVIPKWDGKNAKGEQKAEPRAEKRMCFKIEGGKLKLEKGSKWTVVPTDDPRLQKETNEGRKLAESLGVVIDVLFKCENELFDREALKAKREEKRGTPPSNGSGGHATP